MSKTETRYERLDGIERYLARHQKRGCTTSELAREFGVDPDTIRRDLDLLEARGTGLIKEGRRYHLDHRRIIHTMKISNDEALALYMAARLLSRHSDEHNPHVVSALDKLSDALRSKSPLIADHIARAAAAVRERPVRREYVEALEVLTQGWATGRKVRLSYHSYSKDEMTERLFAPYFIEPSGIGYACYVIGFDDLRSELRTLKVERIRTIRLTDEQFAIPEEFDPIRLLASAWGVIWRDEGTIEVILRFAPQVVRRLKESVWHVSQRLEDCPDGSCLFSVRVGSTVEMKPWIRQWGAAVEVLAPDELRAEMIEEVRAQARLYGLIPHKETH
ncbi:MAG: WYL domain-containing protein [Roseiflexus sp.]|jgi:proteasome accessory factor B|uniref:helix-turn-helix transcriptional regulator n=1 Tax=Roseiflexus sp. (strain RS-1) TaxID=357808 RepID=UPI0000D81087|nr:WYL domain-containing protein [Roseiflexus sp. RS-1]ABQ89072.1 regulatory protein, DeoR [Roseiflexus sp. RS-1]MBO9322036.1 WYL domain-containing protein [Roseiflexus sp.]MBO9326176.1 WYL domain-containing protein [Roseiflexus sp.]MBO9342140.1 WYL domain-containing protein [Roseiflexus sp.]